MHTNGGVEVQLHALFTSVLDGGKWWATQPGSFTPVLTRQKLGGPQSRYGRRGEDKNNLCPSHLHIIHNQMTISFHGV